MYEFDLGDSISDTSVEFNPFTLRGDEDKSIITKQKNHLNIFLTEYKNAYGQGGSDNSI